jgi:hypothetical protein
MKLFIACADPREFADPATGLGVTANRAISP